MNVCFNFWVYFIYYCRKFCEGEIRNLISFYLWVNVFFRIVYNLNNLDVCVGICKKYIGDKYWDVFGRNLDLVDFDNIVVKFVNINFFCEFWILVKIRLSSFFWCCFFCKRRGFKNVFVKDFVVNLWFWSMREKLFFCFWMGELVG